MFADAASIEENHVGIGDVGGERISLPAQTPHYQLAIEHIHLAADGFNVKLLGHYFLSPLRYRVAAKQPSDIWTILPKATANREADTTLPARPPERGAFCWPLCQPPRQSAGAHGH